MGFRFRTLLASAAMVAAFGPLAAAHAQEAPAQLTPDAATSAALAQWRADALSHVDPMFHDAVAAMYADKSLDSPVMNEAVTAKTAAEQAALADLDRSSQLLIEHYFSQVQAVNSNAPLAHDSTSD